jgi:hypothetical protein
VEVDAEEVESSEGRTDPADTDRRLAAAAAEEEEEEDRWPPPERMLELSSVAIKLLFPSTGLAVSRKQGAEDLDEVHSLVPWMRSTTLFH